MAQIFISHSGKDDDLRIFFSGIFAETKVRAVFEEFEKISSGLINNEEIVRDIENSKAVFVLLSQNVENIPHTRDWVIWETGVAKNKDIWIFEPFRQFGRISVIVPCLKHYIIFKLNDAFRAYIKEIVESYDDSNSLSTSLIAGISTAGIGAALAEEEKTKSVVLSGMSGAITGSLFINNLKKRPMGLNVLCNGCFSSYNVHIARKIYIPKKQRKVEVFRCPACNTLLKINRSRKFSQNCYSI